MDDIRQKIIRYATIIIIVMFVIIIAGSFLYKISPESTISKNGASRSVQKNYNGSYTDYDNGKNYTTVSHNREDYDEYNDKRIKKTNRKRVYKDYSVIDDVTPELGQEEEASEEISAVNDKNTAEQKSNIYSKAEALRNINKYESAVYEYEKIAEQSGDSKVKAKCYEEIANTYFSIKRYVPALEFARNSYELKATEPVRKLLIDLYTKTGHPDKAKKLETEKIEEPAENQETANPQPKSELDIEELEPIDFK